ncbi:SDR family NAD(P)-dependent oxidoreductase [Gordonia hydrophobica]|uniref:SDR family NAD(P)-dependent oxidoreductase n=1 Tax=Gordonia hydrophobica TaxID=40516 RepID=A0ABZ2U4Y5_9ACTN|nr:SDR family NAD(P)-dependent oxidoreductase [Gordonia hydrophobica]MBM7369027.1 NAD(P)-dependent dehydrogenase (short-subunit alcohol dehydrogenase family) [Gordonia hydrophobica]
MLRAVRNALLNPPQTIGELRHLVGGRPRPLTGRTVVITGASSGIGASAARGFAQRGATVVAVARHLDALEAVCDSIAVDGGTAHPITADLSDPDDAKRLADHLLERFGVPDVLINNAGRSIRRSVLDTSERFHDYQRTMALNYFGPVQLVLGLLPAMVDADRGHIINVVTWGVSAGSMPKFGAYHASKAALAAFGRSLDAELDGTGVVVTNAGFPLVRTPMIAPTADYSDAPALTSDEAAAWLLRAYDTRPAELYPGYALVLRAVSAVSPRLAGQLTTRLGI